MGILDDAIRAHLELKREHGASEDELARQEREALGPARRETSQEAKAGELAEEELSVAEPDAAPVLSEPEAAAIEPEALPREPEVEAPPVEPGPEPSVDPAPVPEPVTRAGDTPPRGAPALDDPGEAPVPASPEPDGSEEGEDVLEETPEFLQETPEHDRLWFEQKPPRDFDFDDE